MGCNIFYQKSETSPKASIQNIRAKFLGKIFYQNNVETSFHTTHFVFDYSLFCFTMKNFSVFIDIKLPIYILKD